MNHFISNIPFLIVLVGICPGGIWHGGYCPAGICPGGICPGVFVLIPIRHIIQIEKVQRSFTKFITGMRDCSYSDILSLLRLYSLQRRQERYCIIYVWKIIEDLVPNFSKPIVCTHSERRGRYCVVSHVNIGRSGTLSYNSFRWCAIRLFNSMTKFIRCTTSCSVYGFKHRIVSCVRTRGRMCL